MSLLTIDSLLEKESLAMLRLEPLTIGVSGNQSTQSVTTTADDFVTMKMCFKSGPIK